MVIPNRIVLISRGRYEEALSAGDCYPGMILQKSSSGLVLPHSLSGGVGPVMVVEEDALQGGDITQKIASGNVTPYRLAAKGDVLLMLLQTGQNVLNQAPLMSAGDGTLIVSNAAQAGSISYQITAPSTTVTNTATETTFSNGSYAMPANTLLVGDRIVVRAKAFCLAVAAAATQRVRLYIGTTALADSGAQALVANDVVIIEAFLTVRTIGASGTFIADGVVTYSIAGTFTEVPFTVVSTAVDTTAIQTLKVTTLASAAAAGNQIRLDEFQISRQSVVNSTSTLVYAQEAVDNSGGTGTSVFNHAAFIRCLVP